MKTLKIVVLSITFILIKHNACGANFKFLQQQDSTQIKASHTASDLFVNSKYKELIRFCDTEINKLLKQTPIDSLEIAELYQYQGKAHYDLTNYLECIKSDEAGIKYCNDTETGRLLKGRLYSDKASAENYTGKKRQTFNSTLNAIKYLRSLDEPDYDYLITSYRFLSEQCAYFGNKDDAKMYLRRAENLYDQHKTHLDSITKNKDGSVFRYDIILLYSRVYQLYKYGKTKQDSLEIADCVKKFENFHSSLEFSIKNEGIYYSTALNHVGDWYASRKPEPQTTPKDIEKALYYLNTSIDLVENKGYPGILLSTKYNKVKALALSNKLTDAENLINELLESLSENDGRRAYFLAQKALIKAKQKQKDSSVGLFYKAISKVHSDTTILSKDFDNFKPSTSFGHTKLLLRIPEELKRHFPKDTNVNKLVSKLYPMAFFQFENSYDKRKFNKTYDTYLRQIIRGILDTKKYGYNQELTPSYILNRVENIQHLLAWQKFNANRQIDNYHELDSIQLRNFQLRSLIAEAESQNRINALDSLKFQLSQTQKFTKETFPHLSLFNTDDFEIKHLQNSLKKDQIVLRYMDLDDQLAIFAVRKADIDIHLKPWANRDKINLNAFIEQLTAKRYNQNLAEQITAKILPEIGDSINHIIISPDKILSRLSFEVLSRNNKFLLENFDISYTSHLGFILPDLSHKNQNKELAIYAPEYPFSNQDLVVRSKPAFLEGALEESELISQLFPSKLYKGKNLSKEDFVTTASNYQLLHLAMHAQINDNQSNISRLLFSNQDTEADDLYLEELYGLNLSADLAVLSACNTGVGNNNSGSEMESFQRAFTFAGIPATVASLWEVPDQPTKEIMVNFYKNLKDGLPKSEALKEAKITFKNEYKGTKLAQPYYWAGFVLYGTDAPVTTPNSTWIWILVFVLVALLAMAIYLKRLKRRTP